MSIDRYSDRLKHAGILYVDVYPYHLDEHGQLRVLLLQRTPHGELASSWQPVSGKIESGERIRHAFTRHVRAKTGQTPSELYKLDVVNTFYDDYYDTIMFVPCAACRLASEVVQISAKHHVAHRWVDIEGARSLLEWSMQIECIEAIASRLEHGKGFSRFHALEIDG